MTLSTHGLRARPMVGTRARPTACTRVQAVAGGRRGTHRRMGDRQVLHYRSSSPRFGQVDVDIQASATAVQPAVTTQQEQQLEQAVLPRDLGYELHQSQERLQMAKALRLEHAAARQKQHAPQKTADSPTSTPAARSKPAAPLAGTTHSLPAVAPAKPQDSEQVAECTEMAAAAAENDAETATVDVSVPLKQPLQAVVFRFLDGGSTAGETNESSSPTTKSPAPFKDSNTHSKVLGWGNIADVLEAATSSASATPPALSTTAAAQTPTADPSTTAVATVELESRPQCVIPQDQLAVVQVGWAHTPNGAPPEVFYMPDPLAMPCLLEATSSCESLMTYDGELVDVMWQEAERIADLQRAYEEAAARGAASDCSIYSTNTDDSTATMVPQATAREAPAVPEPTVELPAEAPAPTTATVEFRFKCQTQPGERLWLIGDNPVLGAWDLQKAVKLKWSEAHVWRATLELPVGTKVYYKAVLQVSNQQYKWQSGSDYVLEVDGMNQPGLYEFK